MSKARRAVIAALVLLLFVPLAPTKATALPPFDDKATYGAWSDPVGWTFDAVHSVLLPTGKVLVWEGSANAHLFDPRTGRLSPKPYREPQHGTNLFCSAHTVLPDGRVLVAGGHDDAHLLPGAGHAHTSLFDPLREAWTTGPSMKAPRYYPSMVTLADGRALVVSGTDTDEEPVTSVEIFQPGRGWSVLERADREMDIYPFLHVLPSGEVVRVGPEDEALFLDVGAKAWRSGPRGSFHAGGSSVLLPGLDRVLVTGGSLGPGTPDAQILEVGAKPRWRSTAPMRFARRDHNLVLLADGSALAVGGAATFIVGAGNLWPERFDPKTEEWSVMAPAARNRAYHSSAVLLPDGRVLVAGNFSETPTPFLQSMEIFSPPYLFKGPRPRISSAPSKIGYGRRALVRTPDARRISRVALARLGSVTHGVNFDQRYVDVRFKPSGGALEIVAPRKAAEAPPGWYMLFLVDRTGVPSVASMVRIS